LQNNKQQTNNDDFAIIANELQTKIRISSKQAEKVSSSSKISIEIYGRPIGRLVSSNLLHQPLNRNKE